MTDVSVTLRPPCWCPWAPTWRPHTKLYKFGWNTPPNNARRNYRTDPKHGEAVYISIISHIPAPWPNSLNGYDFYFWWRDTANQPLKEATSDAIIKLSPSRISDSSWQWIYFLLSDCQDCSWVFSKYCLYDNIHEPHKLASARNSLPYVK